MLAKRHKLMADWDRFAFVREGDVTAIRYADGAAIKDSADHRAPLAIPVKPGEPLSEGAAKKYRHLRLCC